MKRLLIGSLIAGISISLVVPAGQAKKGGYGNSRSTLQHAVNTLHPTGQARATAEHALNALPNVKTQAPAWSGVKVPPGQAKKFKVKAK